MKNPRIQEVFKKLQDNMGIDPCKDGHAVTLYGTDYSPRTGALLLYATADHDKVLDYLKTKPDFAESKTDDGTSVYTWTEKLGRGKGHKVWAAFPKHGVGVNAENEEALKAALAVFSGKESLSSSSPLLGENPKGTFLHLAATDLSSAHLPGNSPLIKQLDEIYANIGETDGDDFVGVKVKTTDADAAKKIRSILEGVSGMISLQASAIPESQQLINNLKIDSQDKEVTVDFKAAADDLIKLGEKMREMRKQHAQHPAPEQSPPDGSDNK